MSWKQRLEAKPGFGGAAAIPHGPGASTRGRAPVLERLWDWLKGARFGGVASASARLLDRLVPFLAIPIPERTELLRRITMMERHIILPFKAAGIAMLLHSFYSSRWFTDVLGALEISVQWTQYFLWIYIAASTVTGLCLMMIKRLPLALIQWVVFASCLLDSVFLSSLTLVTGGYDSPLYWLFLALIVRSAVSVPRGTSQLMLNFTVSACYVLAGVINISIAENIAKIVQAENLDKATRITSAFAGDTAAEPLVLRLALLLLMTLCSYGVQVLLDRQRLAQEEAREFAVREGQLQSAGRMAAEFAHQIKNPLAIINTAVFSLEKAIRGGRADNVEQQLHIIKEEVEHSDKIITQVMGYAQLGEGRVERVNVCEELDHAIERVFPPGVYSIRIARAYGQNIPVLLMIRRHLAETFMNLLQNAREAVESRAGLVQVTAGVKDEKTIEITIADNGPGIAADKHERIFEAYYTTRERGSGLGLATVKHNVELYGGKVRVDSELGKGARFILQFPVRSLNTPPAPI